ncbi:plasma membrane calcium-transporting ATPase [Sodiomyces alkalinus F11]|uniref:Calcium-transporting ATPase n=1 Tax=Sodiomyces alkalinus (strain CBS 110278 / VKM F-3762 / F11) TaxID=1314773 RepID=A0A3N2PK13_SODAK|nr:plasma membrane calcium-transporting ATPase [Sodiomyces alkalinus F11]ROT34853.1 plasma membrane calcium-transporting ATPase [Sodiomyces alkalinus F11]
MTPDPSPRNDGSQSAGRPRAPTITIDTTGTDAWEASPESIAQDQSRQPGASPVLAQDESISPTTTLDPIAGDWTASRTRSATRTISRFDLRAETSFDSRDSRPQSPHNVSTPVAVSRGNDRAFLAVPPNPRSRQNSVDSDDASRSILSSQGETLVPSAVSEKSGTADHLSNDELMNDDKALKPDQGKEAEFEVEDSPYAFSPGQLNKLLNPKSLAAFYRIGGLTGLEKGIQSDRKAGLGVDETTAARRVTFEQATAHVGRTHHTGDPEEVDVGDTKEAAGASLSTSSSRPNVTSPGKGAFTDRKRVFKDNRLPEKKGKSLLQLMWITYQDKVLMLLTAAAVVSLAIGIYQTVGIKHDPGEPQIEWVEGVAIVIAIVIVVIVGSLNDYSKERQFAKLNRKKQDREVKVIRSGKTMEISVFDILVGDVVHLEPGDLVPVDGLLIEGFNVKCDESQATGESDIIKKRAAEDVFSAIENREDVTNMDPFILSGARVMEGVGTFMVTSTGVNSTYGQTLMSLAEDPEVTPLQSKLNIIAEYIAKIGGAAGLLLFIVLFIRFLVRLPNMSDETPTEKGQMFINIFIVVVTIIVVAVPEGLPLAVTLALAFATTRMLKDNNLVRHLKACEVMGNATNICSDKTGTLTQNKMQVVAATIGTTHRFGAHSSAGSDSRGETADSTGSDVSVSKFVETLSAEVKEMLVKSISFNSTAFEGEVDGKKTFIGSKTETALLLLAQNHLGMRPVSEERASVRTLHLIPFDSGRKCMGIVVSLADGGARLYVKGASEIVLNKCTHIFGNPSADASLVPMTSEDHESINALIHSYASRSLRTIGLAYRDFNRWPPRPPRRHDGDRSEVEFEDIFRRMAFIGVVGIQDPLRDGVPGAVRTCQRAGVCVRMVTGDNKVTAKAIAQECGILQANSLVMEGPEFRNLSKSEQEEIIPRLHVLARSSPEDKRILVKRLKDQGEIVAVTGDGTNDAPALKTADVGFSMGIAGTEVAKEASAIILMDDDFNSIVKALMWGRAVNDAVKRFLQFQLTVNVTAVVLTFVTAVSHEASVLTAVQLLWVNLIMDTLAALALATDPPQKSVLNRRPERRDASIISTTMWKMILGQAAYQLAITFMLFYGGSRILPAGNEMNLEPEAFQAQVNTVVFNTFVWMQIFNQWNNRRLDNKFNIFEGLTKNYFFMGISCVMIGGQILIIFVGGPALQISRHGQTPSQWGVAIVLGFLSIPVGMLIRLIPDKFMRRLVPDYLKRRAKERLPGVTVSDEERFSMYPEPLADVRDELAFLKRMKGGRLNNLKFAVRHPRETFASYSRSPSHSRANSLKTPVTPQRQNSFSSMQQQPLAATPNSRRRSRSNRSRSNSALGAPTVMAGLVAAGVAAGWPPVDGRGRRGEATGGEDREGTLGQNSASGGGISNQVTQTTEPSQQLEKGKASSE